MVKIQYQIKDGFRIDLYGDWSPRAEQSALKAYYAKNKKDFVVGYSFRVQGITMIVTKITDKQKPDVVFSGG